MNDIKEYIERSYYIPLDKKYRSLMSKKRDFSKRNKIISFIFFMIKKIFKYLYKLVQVFDAQKINIQNLKNVDIDYGKYDVIFSCSDPKSSHLIAKRILKEKRLLWIQYWGDPMFNDITKHKNIFDFYVRFQEKKLLEASNLIYYASPLTLDLQKITFPSLKAKMRTMNQVALDNNDCMKTNNSFDSERLKIVYSGSYNTRIRNILPLYNSFANSNNVLKIVGSSNIKLEEKNNIQVDGVVDFKRAQSIEQEADILVTICNNKGTQIPGKIYYYAQYNKPIIVVLDGDLELEIHNFLIDFNRYIFCSNNEESIKKAIDLAKNQLLEKRDYYKIPFRLSTKHMGIELTKEIRKIKENYNEN
jgi:hypothetical protein